MKVKNTYPVLGLLAIVLVINGCQTGQALLPPPQELYAHFQSIPLADTMAVKRDTVMGDSGRGIPAQLFFAGLDSALINELIYEPDTFDFRCRAYWKIELDKHSDACLLGIQEGWFQFKYLLVYSSQTKRFEEIVPVAYLYGGEGGQVISESRIFDLDTQPTILILYLEHYLRWSETDPDEPEDINIRRVGLKQWSGEKFQEITVRDSNKWLQRYPLVW